MRKLALIVGCVLLAVGLAVMVQGTGRRRRASSS
jgi:hypothetical protein